MCSQTINATHSSDVIQGTNLATSVNTTNSFRSHCPVLASFSDKDTRPRRYHAPFWFSMRPEPESPAQGPSEPFRQPAQKVRSLVIFENPWWERKQF